MEEREKNQDLVCFGSVLRHKNHYRLFNTKFGLYVYMIYMI